MDGKSSECETGCQYFMKNFQKLLFNDQGKCLATCKSGFYSLIGLGPTCVSSCSYWIADANYSKTM